MNTLSITGPQKVNGEIQISGAKNGALPLLLCSLLTDQTFILSNVPLLTDIDNMLTLLQEHGAVVVFDKQNKKVAITCKRIKNDIAPVDIVNKMRASIWVLAPLLARHGSAVIPLPGGCPLEKGGRKIDMHIELLQSMGATIKLTERGIEAKAKNGLKSTNFKFKFSSVGSSINAILACVITNGISILENCSIEPEVVDLCNCLIKMGARISGVGGRTLEINGVSMLNPVSYEVMPDRIEAATYLIAGAITKGRIKVNNINKSFLEIVCDKLEEAGNKIFYNENSIELISSGEIVPVDITTEPFPGFPTDVQAQFTSLMCFANGASRITETIYNNRMMHIHELQKMGANISIKDNQAIIQGVKKLHSSQHLMASDLRASFCLILAAICVQGNSIIHEAQLLNRGYESFISKLAGCGIEISKVGDRWIDKFNFQLQHALIS